MVEKEFPTVSQDKELSVIPREVLKEKYKGKFGHKTDLKKLISIGDFINKQILRATTSANPDDYCDGLFYVR